MEVEQLVIEIIGPGLGLGAACNVFSDTIIFDLCTPAVVSPGKQSAFACSPVERKAHSKNEIITENTVHVRCMKSQLGIGLSIAPASGI